MNYNDILYSEGREIVGRFPAHFCTVTIRADEKSIPTVKKWIKENLQGPWSICHFYKTPRDTYPVIKIGFESETDLLMFRLAGGMEKFNQ